MLTNYEVRNNCFRVKKGLGVRNKQIIDLVEQKKGNFAWQDFAVNWDVIVKNNDILVFESIKDITAVSEVCGRKSLAEEMNLQKEWTPEEEAIIYMIECQFLENKMTWTNYKKVWRLTWNDEQKRVNTELIRPVSNQIQQPKPKPVAKPVVKQEVVARNMSEEEKEYYSNLLLKKLNNSR